MTALNAHHDGQALGRLTNTDGGSPGRLTPTEDLPAVVATSDAEALQSEGGVDRPGGSGDERAKRAKGRSPLVRSGVPTRAARGARARNDSAGGAVSKPGASNTRRNTPPKAQYGGAKHDASHPIARTRALAARVDALEIAYRGKLRDDVRAQLEAGLADLKANGAACVEIAGNVFALGRGSRSGWWNLQIGTCHVIISDDASLQNWVVSVKTLAHALATHGPRVCVAIARTIADAVIDVALEERVRRVDLCADFVAFPLDGIESSQFMTPRRANVRAHFIDPTRTSNAKRDRCTGFTVGKGALSARVYDKTQELIDKPNDEKREIEHALWRRGDWNGHDAVTRVEFQLRGDALKELWDGELRDPDRLLSKLDSIWQYGCRDWLRLIDLASATRRDRCANDVRWSAVQAARFTEHAVAEPLRVRRRGAARARSALGVTLGFAARADFLDALINLDDGEERGEARSEILLCAGLQAFGTDAGAAIGRALVDELGGRRAVAYVAARARASRARIATWRSNDAAYGSVDVFSLV